MEQMSEVCQGYRALAEQKKGTLAQGVQSQVSLGQQGLQTARDFISSIGTGISRPAGLPNSKKVHFSR